MLPFLFGFQIFITILLSLVIIFQKSSSDGIVVSNAGGQMPSRSQATFISKFTILLILNIERSSVQVDYYIIYAYDIMMIIFDGEYFMMLNHLSFEEESDVIATN